ncbi:MAG: dockerin type I domain-containing protein [Myxococcota bacterium]|jgi:hypothetical protein|nr:dockerin type I domain-containing protein [Myxococcota bacterium]
MVRTTMALLAAITIALAAPAAFAAAGDCNGDGQVDAADLDALVAANNTPAEGTPLTGCDYDGDGVISLADAAEHISQSR